MHQAGVSVRDRTVSEEGMELEDYEDHLADWPGEDVDEEDTSVERTGDLGPRAKL